jgi:hypothetical protein
MSPKRNWNTQCCCCICKCKDDAVKEEKCCFCCPIICGVQFIAISVILICLVQFIEIFYQLLNDNIEWWYVLVGVGITIPLMIATGLAISYLADPEGGVDKGDSVRVGLQSAGILVIISVALLATWNACYFTLLYKAEKVATGNDGIGYLTVTVKQQVVFSIWIAAVTCCFFAYYLCVLSNFKTLYREGMIAKW